MNQSIWDVFVHESVFLSKIDEEGMIDEEEEDNNKKKIEEKTIIKGKENNNDNEIRREPSKHFPLKEKELEQEFWKVFEMINDDCIHIEPKLIPIIPGDDPAIINKVSDFCEDNF